MSYSKDRMRILYDKVTADDNFNKLEVIEELVVIVDYLTKYTIIDFIQQHIIAKKDKLTILEGLVVQDVLDVITTDIIIRFDKYMFLGTGKDDEFEGTARSNAVFKYGTNHLPTLTDEMSYILNKLGSKEAVIMFHMLFKVMCK